MNKKFIVLCTLATCAATAQAQTNVTFFGLIDTTIRYSTNENAAGDSRLQMTDGVQTGSRWGVRSIEDLGGGNKAIVMLESGFAPDTGSMLQGNRLFGRQGYVGLEGGFGKVLLGRQYTVAHDTLASFEVFGFSNNAVLGYQGIYTGARHDNLLKYSIPFGGVTVTAGYTFGEIAGDTGANSAKAISATYTGGPLYLGAVYQETNTVAPTFFNATPALPVSKQTVWGLGGTYQFDPAKLYFGYTNNKLDVADLKNDVVYVGFSSPITPAIQLSGTVQYDKVKRPAGDGVRWTSGLMLDYFLSKRTDIYVEVDYTKLKDGWVGLANTAGLGSGNMFGNDSRAGVMLGVRHKF